MGHIITVFTDGFLEFLVKLLSLSTAFDKFWIVKEVVMSHTKLCHFIQAIRALLNSSGVSNKARSKKSAS